MSNAGQILMMGITEHPNPGMDKTYAYVYDLRSRKFTKIGDGRPFCLNDRGDVVYGAQTTTAPDPDGTHQIESERAVLVQAGGHGVSHTVDLQESVALAVTVPPPANVSVNPAAINHDDAIVGCVNFASPNGVDAYDAVAVRAFAWIRGTAKQLDLSDANSAAVAVNDAGQIVGNAERKPAAHADEIVTYPFLYEGGKLVDLNLLLIRRLPRRLIEAFAVNGPGQILASDGKFFYLLTPKRARLGR
jgi:uncharacterized membrane protein